MRIMGPPTAAYGTVSANLRALGASTLFRRDMFPQIYGAAMHYGIDPVLLVAQSAKETAYGRFGRATTPAHHNTAGIKINPLPPEMADNDPDAHATFPSWNIGAQAHAQHLRAYAGVYFPSWSPIYSPRYPIVKSLGLKITHIEELGGGRWAPDPNYGRDVVELAKLLSLV